MDRLGYTSTAASTRVSRLISKIYREIGTSIGMSFTRQTAATEVVTIGQANVTFYETEKVLQVWILDGSSNPVILGEVLLAELRGAIIPSSDKPTVWALVSTTSNGVTIRLNAAPETAYTLYADVIAEVSDLSGSSEPAFPESFHDILIEGVLRDEYRKLEKVALARDSSVEFQRRLSDLRMFVAKSSYMDIQQGKLSDSPSGRAGGGTATQAVIGPASSTDNAIARFNGTGGTIIQDSGITIADGASGTLAGSNSGDVTLAGTPDYITLAGQIITRAQIDLTADVTGELPTANIAAAAVTYAKIQDISAASRLLGRGSAAGSGDTEEITLGSGLSMSATTLSASATITKSLCQGRLTLTTATPVTTADVTAATTLYWALHGGNQVALYTGSEWVVSEVAELSVAIPATTATMYDIFIDYNAGTPALVLTAWTNVTTRATALTKQDGVLVQTGNLDWRYVGSMCTTNVSGQTEDSLAKRLVWNMYNRVDTGVRRLDSTNSWTYSTATWRQAGASAANQIEIVVGMAEDPISLQIIVVSANSNANVGRYLGFGEDSTSTIYAGTVMSNFGTDSTANNGAQHQVALTTYPAIGYHYYAWLEYSDATATTTWYGDNNNPTVWGTSGMHGRWRR